MRFAPHLSAALAHCCTAGVLSLVSSATMPLPAADDPPPGARDGRTVLVSVNDQPLTEADLQVHFLTRRIPPEVQDEMRKPMLEQLIDQRLLEAFLVNRKAEPDPAELDRQLQLIRQVVGRAAENPDAVLARLGYTDEALRRQLSLPLAWKTHISRVVTDQQLRDYFAKHRAELDGTQVHARQIVLVVDADAAEPAWDAAAKRLQDLRERIVSEDITFAAAAREQSAGPSKSNGGDLGWIDMRGRIPGPVASAALALQAGEVSTPIRSAVGVHLVTVEDRRPGDLSLEDVRLEVRQRLSQSLWNAQVQTERKQAKIEWSPPYSAR